MAYGLDVLYDPDGFFETAPEEPKARYPIFIIVVISIIGSAGFGFTAQVFLGKTDFGAALTGALTIVAFVGQVLGNLFIWLLFGSLFFAIATLMDGEGDFKKTLVLVGWGFLPRIVGALASAIITFFVFSSVESPNLQTEDPTQLQQEMMSFLTDVSNTQLDVVGAFVGIVILLWSAYIWVAAVEVEQNLERKQALIAVGIPVAFALLWRLNGLVGAL